MPAPRDVRNIEGLFDLNTNHVNDVKKTKDSKDSNDISEIDGISDNWRSSRAGDSGAESEQDHTESVLFSEPAASRPLPYRGIHHIALATRDMEATIRFWRDLLGMPLIAGLGRPGYRQYFFRISRRDRLAVFEWPDVTPLEPKDHGVPVSGPFAFDHIALEVPDADALWNMKDGLEAAGFWASEIVDHGFFLSLYSFDPNEVPIEFCLPLEKKDAPSLPLITDPDPPEAAKEGMHPRLDYWPRPFQETSAEKRVVAPGEKHLVK